MRVLLIRVGGGSTGGREQLSSILSDSLRHVMGDELDVYELRPNVHAASILERLIGRIDGITTEVEKDLLNIIVARPYDCVLIDGSNLGRLVKLVKSQVAAIPVITFYHNVEARFFLDLFRSSRTVRSAGVLLANYISERFATHYSDFRLMLNDRDSQQLRAVYGRPGTHPLPMVVRDYYDPAAAQLDCPLAERYALFVGGAFYANVEGLAWYAENIGPHSPIPTIVIGRGMEAHRARLEQWGGVRVVGAVDDLAPWYAHAQIVVAPILSGSGMKTKTAEAFMHGKPIAGTIEAFEGYRRDISDSVITCETPEDFLQALNKAANLEVHFNHELRSEYVKFHSESAMQERLTQLLQSVQMGGSE